MSIEPAQVRVRILGPFACYAGQRDVTPKGVKQRQILAMLTLNAGRLVSAAALAEELWGEHPPRSAPSALQTHVLHLRDRLAIGDGEAWARTEVIRTKFGGYLIDAQSCHTDIEDFEALARDGRRAAEVGDHQAASEQLSRALAVWQGRALADIPVGPVLELEVASLEGTRLGLLERRLEADLALSRHGDIVGELTLLAARHPLNENFCALLMTALYRCGHTDLALAAFRKIRDALSTNLGIEPCPRLQRLQRAMLSGDPSLEPVSRP